MEEGEKGGSGVRVLTLVLEGGRGRERGETHTLRHTPLWIFDVMNYFLCKRGGVGRSGEEDKTVGG